MPIQTWRAATRPGRGRCRGRRRPAGPGLRQAGDPRSAQGARSVRRLRGRRCDRPVGRGDAAAARPAPGASDRDRDHLQGRLVLGSVPGHRRLRRPSSSVLVGLADQERARPRSAVRLRRGARDGSSRPRQEDHPRRHRGQAPRGRRRRRHPGGGGQAEADPPGAVLRSLRCWSPTFSVGVAAGTARP